MSRNSNSNNKNTFLGNRHMGPYSEYDSYGDMNAGYDQDYNMSNNYNSTGYTPAESTRYNRNMVTGTINDINGPPAYKLIDQFSARDPRERYDAALDQTPYRQDNRTTGPLNLRSHADEEKALRRRMYQMEKLALMKQKASNFGNRNGSNYSQGLYDNSKDNYNDHYDNYDLLDTMRKYVTPSDPNEDNYQYGDRKDWQTSYKNIDFRKTDPYKKEKRYINGALVTDVTKNGSMNSMGPQAYTDATGVGLRVIQTDRVRRDIAESSDISLGYATDFDSARPGSGATENMAKTFY